MAKVENLQFTNVFLCVLVLISNFWLSASAQGFEQTSTAAKTNLHNEKPVSIEESYESARIVRNSLIRGVSRFKRTAPPSDVSNGKQFYDASKVEFNLWIQEEVQHILNGTEATHKNSLTVLRANIDLSSRKLNQLRKAKIVDNLTKLYTLAIANEPYAQVSVSNSDEEKERLKNGFNAALGGFQNLFSLACNLVERGTWIVQLGRLKLPNYEDIPAEIVDSNLLVLDPINWPGRAPSTDNSGQIANLVEQKRGNEAKDILVADTNAAIALVKKNTSQLQRLGFTAQCLAIQKELANLNLNIEDEPLAKDDSTGNFGGGMPRSVRPVPAFMRIPDTGTPINLDFEEHSKDLISIPNYSRSYSTKKTKSPRLKPR